MLDPALPQGALPQVVDAVLSRRQLRGLQVRHVSVSGYAFRAAACHGMLSKGCTNGPRLSAPARVPQGLCFATLAPVYAGL